ncbi:MAG TPA: hypothetical protein VJ123_00730 [Anaerolineales bacterium]|nr:hypothetical protein [Anaerolineales bacterium]
MRRQDLKVEAAERRLRQHQERGLHVDARLFQEIRKPGQLSLVTLETDDEFLSLVWQAIDDTRPLAPHGQPRALRDCASRLSTFKWSFEVLVRAGYPWFRKCVPIDAAFAFEQFGWVAITPLVRDEQRGTPHGSYYIYDGVHKSIVLAKRLLCGEAQYAPTEALLLEPRRY